MPVHNICRFRTSYTKSADIEAYVFTEMKLDIPNVNWGYVAGRPVFYIESDDKPTQEALNEIETKLREKGFKTYGGGLPEVVDVFGVGREAIPEEVIVKKKRNSKTVDDEWDEKAYAWVEEPTAPIEVPPVLDECTFGCGS
jgi:hypothetical protein